MSREWFDEFLDFLKNPPYLNPDLDLDLSPIALYYYRKHQEEIESQFEDEEYSDLLRAKMIAVMESPLFLDGQVRGRRQPSPPQNPRYKKYEIIDLWPTLLSPEGFVEIISRTLLAVDLSNDTSYLKNIGEHELSSQIERLLNTLATTTPIKGTRKHLESQKIRYSKKFPTSFKPLHDWQELVAFFFRKFIPDPNKSELAKIISDFLESLGYEANIETIRDKLKPL